MTRHFSTPILTYHHVSDDIDYYTAVKKIDFTRQLSAVLSEFEVVSFDKAYSDYISGEPSKNQIVLTFDDGYKDTLETLYDLADKGITATSFIAAGTVGKDNLWNHKAPYIARIVDREDIANLLKRGHTIGSHGMTHQYLNKLDDSALHDEIVSSKFRLEQITGNEVKLFCYPFGAYDDRVVNMVKLQYQAALATNKTGVKRSGDPYRIYRLSVNYDTTIHDIMDYLHGEA